MHLVLDRTPAPTHAERVAGIRAGQDYYHRLGITACQDALVNADWQRAYEDLARSGELGLRVRGALEWGRRPRRRAAPRAVEAQGERQRGPPRVRPRQVLPRWRGRKLDLARLDPYLDDAGRPTAEYGIDMYARADLERFVGRCDAAGFGVHIHTIGDRAVRESLDALEAAIGRNGRRDARHQLAHVQFAHPDDLPRFAALGVIANVTPLWARLEEYVTKLTLPFVSDTAAAGMYPFASILRAGGCAGVRKRLVGVDAGSLCTSLRPPSPASTPGGSADGAAARRRAARPGRGDRRAHDRRRSRLRARRGHGLDRAGQAGRPGGARSRPARPATPRDYLGARVLATLVEGAVVYAAPESELSLST